MPSPARLLVAAAVLALATLGAGSAALARPSVDLRLMGTQKGVWFGAADAASMPRHGDKVTLSFVIMFRERQANGSDYEIFIHTVDCAAHTLATAEEGGYTAMGVKVVSGAGSTPAHAIDPHTSGESEFALVCQGSTDAPRLEGVTYGQGLMELRRDWATNDPDEATLTDYWIVAGASGELYLMDTTSLRREGDLARIKVIAVRKHTGPDGFDYVIGDDEFNCAAGTTQTVAAGGYHAGGGLAGDFSQPSTGAHPVNANDALDQAEFNFACKGQHAGYQMGNVSALDAYTTIHDDWDNYFGAR
jgi:hypothetical protein